MNVLETAIAKPKRWDQPFGADMSDAEVDRLLRIEPFRSVDRSKFPPNLSLEGILRNDTRIVTYQTGDLVVREGDYGNSAFMLLHGSLRVALERLSPELIGAVPDAKRSWWTSLKQVWGERQIPEVRTGLGSNGAPAPLPTRGEGKSTHVFLQDVPCLLDSTRTATLAAGEFFGELAALSRTPRTATIFAESPSILLEIRWQGLRDLMRRTPAIQHHVDQLYRENSLRVHLRQTPLFAKLGDAALQQVAEATQFESIGNFDWNVDLADRESLTPLERLAREPVIAQEGTTIEHVLLVRTGFARLSRRFGEGHRTLAYLGKGDSFGLEELLAWGEGEPPRFQFSLRGVGHVDLLKIPAEVIREVVLPTLTPGERNALAARIAPPVPQSNQALPLAPPLIDFLVDERLINGTQAMVIDLNRCTRCDDCVRACAATHDGNPRFVREGPRYEQFQFAGACMHCVDPVCMIGCPTGAIHRDTATGVVRINDPTCVGCGTCAESCPYSNIRMTEIRDPQGLPVLDLEQGFPIVKATKCDLCAEQIAGPACQNACAHDALIRLDLADLPATAAWINR